MGYRFRPEPPPRFNVGQTDPAEYAQLLADYLYRQLEEVHRDLIKNRSGWGSIDIPTTSTRLSGGSQYEPDWTLVRDDGAGSRGVWAYEFKSNRDEELLFSFMTPPGRDARNRVLPRFHWISSNTNTGFVRWGVELSEAAALDVFPNTSIYTTDSYGRGVSHQHIPAEFTQGESTGGVPDKPKVVMGRMFRAGSDDTYTGSAWLPLVNFRVLLLRLGADNPYHI